MYKDIFESIRNEAEKRNLRERTIQLYCSDVSYFLRWIEKNVSDAKEWIPYCKKPFDGAESVIRYLGKYTHRIAISNYRIKSMTEATVTFSAKKRSL